MAPMPRLARWFVNRRARARARSVLRRLGPALALDRSSTVLELGCGAGGFLEELVRTRAPARVVGTDLDPLQLEAARERLLRSFGTMPASVELRSADALALPFADGTFHCVVALAMLHHVEERHGEFVRRPDALREIRRVLRPGGLLVYSEFLGREPTRRVLEEIGFVRVTLLSGWRWDLGVFRRGGETGTVPGARGTGGPS